MSRNMNLFWLLRLLGNKPVPPEPTEYEYPTFSINSDGILVANYLTDNRNLTFQIIGDTLYANYTGQDPKLSLIGDTLYREV